MRYTQYREDWLYFSVSSAFSASLMYAEQHLLLLVYCAFMMANETHYQAKIDEIERMYD